MIYRLWDCYVSVFSGRVALRFPQLSLLASVSLVVASALAFGLAAETPDADRWFRLGRESSLADRYQQGLLFALATAMAALAFRWRSRLGGGLAALFFFMWFDDAMMYHETLGRILSARFDLPVLPGLREQDTAELVAWAAAAGLLSLPIFWATVTGDRRDLALGLLFLPLVPALITVGVVLDLVHAATPGILGRMFGQAEDGGELLVLTFGLSLTVALLTTNVDIPEEVFLPDAKIARKTR